MSVKNRVDKLILVVYLLVLISLDCTVVFARVSGDGDVLFDFPTIFVVLLSIMITEYPLYNCKHCFELKILDFCVVWCGVVVRRKTMVDFFVFRPFIQVVYTQ